MSGGFGLRRKPALDHKGDDPIRMPPITIRMIQLSEPFTPARAFSRPVKPLGPRENPKYG